MNPEKKNGSHCDNYVDPRFQPIQPGLDLKPGLDRVNPGQFRADRSSLILFLAILSLFMCGPVGVAAWIMAGSDLRKIRKGLLSPQKAGVLRIGRALGIIGTAIFVVAVIVGASILQQKFGQFNEILGSTPLQAENSSFTGEWIGKYGTIIKIYSDGRADFKGSRARVTGGRVNIEGETLSIRMLGFSKKFHIDTHPHIENGNWTMQLDGEIFIRRLKGQLII